MLPTDTDIGRYTCAGFEGSWRHERTDALTFAQWGFDLVEADSCVIGMNMSGPDGAATNPPQPPGTFSDELGHRLMHDAIVLTNDVGKRGRQTVLTNGVGKRCWQTVKPPGMHHPMGWSSHYP